MMMKVLTSCSVFVHKIDYLPHEYDSVIQFLGLSSQARRKVEANVRFLRELSKCDIADCPHH